VAERGRRPRGNATVAAATGGDDGRYDRVARALHWLVAALAVIVVSLGLASTAAARNTPARDGLLLLHRSIGLTILALMLFRALWRGRHPPPLLPSALPRLEAVLARLSHLGLYLIFIAMPLAGYVNAAAAGHPVSLFGIVSIPPLLPVDERVSQVAIAVHLAGQYLVYLLVALHIAGALYHTIVRRDGVLGRMLPRRRPGRGRSEADEQPTGR
jgi:cytochrome b561